MISILIVLNVSIFLFQKSRHGQSAFLAIVAYDPPVKQGQGEQQDKTAKEKNIDKPHDDAARC